jgi:hypothetical protein
MVQPLGDPVPRRDKPPRGFLRAVSVGRDVASSASRKACACGHGKPAHHHYRAGSDCALCSCRKYHRSLLGRLGLG